MLDTPTIDLVDKLVRVIGIPGIIAAIVWLVKAFDKGASKLNEITNDTSETRRMAVETLGNVNTIQTNHLAHLADDMKKQAEKQDATVTVLTNIDKNIALLVDRTPRA